MIKYILDFVFSHNIITADKGMKYLVAFFQCLPKFNCLSKEQFAKETWKIQTNSIHIAITIEVSKICITATGAVKIIFGFYV